MNEFNKHINKHINDKILDLFIKEIKAKLGNHLKSIIIFGSRAQDKNFIDF